MRQRANLRRAGSRVRSPVTALVHDGRSPSFLCRDTGSVPHPKEVGKRMASRPASGDLSVSLDRTASPLASPSRDSHAPARAAVAPGAAHPDDRIGAVEPGWTRGHRAAAATTRRRRILAPRPAAAVAAGDAAAPAGRRRPARPLARHHRRTSSGSAHPAALRRACPQRPRDRAASAANTGARRPHRPERRGPGAATRPPPPEPRPEPPGRARPPPPSPARRSPNRRPPPHRRSPSSAPSPACRCRASRRSAPTR